MGTDRKEVRMAMRKGNKVGKTKKEVSDYIHRIRAEAGRKGGYAAWGGHREVYATESIRVKKNVAAWVKGNAKQAGITAGDFIERLMFENLTGRH